MGMNAKAINYFFEILKIGQYTDFSQVAVCFFGNQKIRIHASHFPEYDYRIFKALLVAKGFQRSDSFDVNGKSGAIPLDISLPLKEEWKGKFDIVLNSGTIEHILHNQYQVFKNVHDLLKDKGLMMHILPVEERGHGFYFYDEAYFGWLAWMCKYKILDCRLTNTDYKYNAYRHYLFITLRKNELSKFVDLKDWKDPHVDSIGVGRYGDQYDSFIKVNLEKANG